MYGRYLRWAIEQGKCYLGLDIVPRYVEAGRKTVIKLGLSPQHYQFVLGGAEEIAKLVKPKQLLVEPQRCLLLFPFNSFGNILNPSPVVTGLRESGLPFLISSYSTTAEATACREQYYRNCGYHELHLFEDERGVHFVSPDGLHSIAFHLKYLQKLCAVNGITVEAVPFSKIGVAYTTMTISRCIA